MANTISTLKQAKKLQSNLWFAKKLCTPMVITQPEENIMVVNILVAPDKFSLTQLKNLDINIKGCVPWSFLGDEPQDLLEVEIKFAIDEDWELEHDIHTVFGAYGYIQPTDLVRAKLSLVA